MNLREIADEAIAEVEDSCEVGIEECRSKFGPGKCRFHCTRYLDLIRDSVSCEEAKASLQKEGIKVTSLDDAMKEGCDSAARMFCNRFADDIKSIGRSEFDKTVRSLYATILDLKERFPNLEVPKFIFVPADVADGGSSTVDSVVSKESIVVANACHDFSNWDGFSFGHDDNRLPYDVIRHEIGHASMTNELVFKWKDLISSRLKTYGVKRLRDDLEIVSGYSSFDDSQESMLRFPYESFAEAFSKITSSDFKSGDVPEWILSFFKSYVCIGGDR